MPKNNRIDRPKQILGPGHKGGKGSLVNSKRKIVSWENSVKRDINQKLIFCLKINLSKFVEIPWIFGFKFSVKKHGFLFILFSFPAFFLYFAKRNNDMKITQPSTELLFLVIFLIWSRSIECQRTEWMMALINIIWELPFWSFDALKGN